MPGALLLFIRLALLPYLVGMQSIPIFRNYKLRGTAAKKHSACLAYLTDAASSEQQAPGSGGAGKAG